MATATALLLASSGAASGAGPGDTFPTALLPLPPGAIAGADSGLDALGYPSDAGVSSDGRYVAFLSAADTLAPAAALDVVNVFRKDRATGAVALVSRADGADGASAPADADNVTISDDGNRVGWTTQARLVPADVDDDEDVYVRDLATGQTLLATAVAGPGAGVSDYDLSGDGAWIAFTSDERLTAGDVNADDDVYRVAVAGGAALLVSAGDGTSTSGDDDSGSPSISGDGTWVAFDSSAGDLIGGFVDGNGGRDIWARDVTARATYLVSTAYGVAGRSANNSSSTPLVAGSPPSGGSTNVDVIYNSYATDLAAPGTDVDTEQAVYRRNLGTRFMARPVSALVSRADGVAGTAADDSAYAESVSDDGRHVVFSTRADNLGVTGQGFGAYLRDMTAGTTALGSVGRDEVYNGAISGDGSLFVWVSGNGVTPDSDPDASGVFARAHVVSPPTLGAPELVSRPAGTAPFLLPALWDRPAGHGERSISANGRYVLFVGATSRDLVGLGKIGVQVYRRDVLTGALELVSRANGAAGGPSPSPPAERSISADGTRVVFVTDAALDPADGDGFADAYLRDLASATTTLVSRADGLGGDDADADVRAARISADGTHVVFDSTATNLGTPGGDRHVYLRDVAAGTTVVVDRADGAAGTLANDDSGAATLSADGRLVAFVSNANTLDPADPGPSVMPDVYVRDTVAATVELVSRRSGAGGQKAASAAGPVISADGRTVAFMSDDETLAPEGGAWGATSQIVARDLVTHQNALVSRAAGGAVANANASVPSISDDGGTIAFVSEATNLLPGVGGGGRPAVFARTSATGVLAGPPAFGTLDGSDFGAVGPSLSGDGRCLSFTGTGHNVFTGAAGDTPTAYVHVLAGTCSTPQPQLPPPPRAPQQPPSRPVISTPLPRPTLTQVSLLRARFRVGKSATAVAAARRAGARRRKPTPAGSAVRFTLNTRASLTIAIERSSRGRKVGKACRRATPRLRRRRACARWTTVATLRRNGIDGGRRSIAFSGRIGRRALAAGGYRVTVKAGNASGASKPVTLAFTIVRR
ncbi:hypothetical protein VSS74_00770 [Conexibacter stalactiti]|uniref:Uncharacterized protein n=1 Tax=Conexibacter stalactiti TaxID=1940611 RepID=A0ABU4HLF7_9ACTN|nr:hypothetical protein [Conexibacter stalactiti]MDW5592849.1 hypothetical protein [Conexibacter stalactiti]MEC5033490.1 hypothetical protein [Conexibacter stalactiti]